MIGFPQVLCPMLNKLAFGLTASLESNSWSINISFDFLSESWTVKKSSCEHLKPPGFRWIKLVWNLFTRRSILVWKKIPYWKENYVKTKLINVLHKNSFIPWTKIYLFIKVYAIICFNMETLVNWCWQYMIIFFSQTVSHLYFFENLKDLLQWLLVDTASQNFRFFFILCKIPYFGHVGDLLNKHISTG